MKDYSNDNPQFSSSIQIVEVTDPAHADNVNAAPKQLLDNDAVLASVLNVDLIDQAFKREFPYLNELLT